MFVDDVVNRGAGGRGEADAEQAEEKGIDTRRALGGEQHADHRGEHDQQHHLGLGQVVVLRARRRA